MTLLDEAMGAIVASIHAKVERRMAQALEYAHSIRTGALHVPSSGYCHAALADARAAIVSIMEDTTGDGFLLAWPPVRTACAPHQSDGLLREITVTDCRWPFAVVEVVDMQRRTSVTVAVDSAGRMVVGHPRQWL